MEIYRILGYRFLEIVYKDAMEFEFINREFPFSREEEHKIYYKGKMLKHRFFIDFILFDEIIVEVKTNGEGINNDVISQTLNYLKSGGFRLGLVINFGKRKLEYKRVIFLFYRSFSCQFV